MDPPSFSITVRMSPKSSVWLLNGWNTVQSFGVDARRTTAFAVSSIGDISVGSS